MQRDPETTAGESRSCWGDAVDALAAPAAAIRQVPCQPMCDGLAEDDLIVHAFVQYARTGDASWPLLLPMQSEA